MSTEQLGLKIANDTAAVFGSYLDDRCLWKYYMVLTLCTAAGNSGRL